MHLTVDEMRCAGHGQCEFTAPELFELGSSDKAKVLIPDPPTSLYDAARAAVRNCPALAIALSE